MVLDDVRVVLLLCNGLVIYWVLLSYFGRGPGCKIHNDIICCPIKKKTTKNMK